MIPDRFLEKTLAAEFGTLKNQAGETVGVDQGILGDYC
jgi:hypothetical protein